MRVCRLSCRCALHGTARLVDDARGAAHGAHAAVQPRAPRPAEGRLRYALPAPAAHRCGAPREPRPARGRTVGGNTRTPPLPSPAPPRARARPTRPLTRALCAGARAQADDIYLPESVAYLISRTKRPAVQRDPSARPAAASAAEGVAADASQAQRTAAATVRPSLRAAPRCGGSLTSARCAAVVAEVVARRRGAGEGAEQAAHGHALGGRHHRRPVQDAARRLMTTARE
jgi:hypothetical protein